MAGGRFGAREDSCSAAGFESGAQSRVIELDINVRNRTAGLFALTVFAEYRSDNQRFSARPRACDTAGRLGHRRGARRAAPEKAGSRRDRRTGQRQDDREGCSSNHGAIC